MTINLPTTYNIFGITIGVQGIFFVLAYLTALIVTMIRAKRRNLDTDFILGILINAIIFGILGAKLLYIIAVARTMYLFNFFSYLLKPYGFVAYGGIILGILSNLIWCFIKKKDFYTYFDIVMPSVAAAQAVGRMGCLCNGCCYGYAETTWHWYNIMYTQSKELYNFIPYIPVQLISAIGDLLICIILIIASNKIKTKGYIATLYMILYGVGRFFVEFLRADKRGNVGPLSTSQFISIIIVIIAIIQFIYCKNRDKIKEYIRLKIEHHKEEIDSLKKARELQKRRELRQQQKRRRKNGKKKRA